MAMTVGTLLPFVLGVLAPFVVPDLGLSRARFGALTSVYYLVGIAGSLVVGTLVDRLGGRRMLVVLFASGGASMLLLSAAGSYPILVAAALVAGVSTAGVNPVTNQLLARHIPQGGQGVLVGVKQSGVYLGSAVVGLALPPAAAAAGWRATVGAVAVPAAVGLLMTRAWVPAGHPHRTATSDRAAGVRASMPGVVRLAVAALLVGTGVAATAVYLSLYAFEAIGLTATAAGAVVAVTGLAAIAARIGWGRMAERRRNIGTLLVWLAGGSGASLVILLGAVELGWPLLWVGAVAVGSSGNAFNAVVMLAIVRDAWSGATGRASGIVQLAFYIGMLVAPVSFGWIVDRTGDYVLGWAGVAVASLAAVPVLITWRRRATLTTPATRLPGATTGDAVPTGPDR